MNAETLVALFTGTGLATVIGVIYTIIKEHRGNTQKDMAGDLTLGELFREAARREVVQVQADMTNVQSELRTVREVANRQEEQIRELLAAGQRCELRCKILLDRWPREVAPPPEIEI